MPATYQIQINVTVDDADALRRAAEAGAVKHMSLADWQEMRDSNLSPVAADLHMLLDPGQSPLGLTILDSHVEYIDGEEDAT